ncbi:reverse transcriptase [Elysia marginata]|uniref:Reverse transcriptase n=1 Tax=Elysia marginata TaxID=1093978 RepID=A0AAV4EF77_9GAST|nr:reverse transcriptase [Elysia marginata]
MKDEHYRDEMGGLARFKSGRRFVYINIPKTPLIKMMKVGANFTAYLYYREQSSSENGGRTNLAQTNEVKGREVVGNSDSSGTAPDNSKQKVDRSAHNSEKSAMIERARRVLISKQSTLDAFGAGVRRSRSAESRTKHHRAVVTQFVEDPFPRGPSRWQFNASLLKSKDFVEHMNIFIPNFLEDTQNVDIDCGTKWELIKTGMRLECFIKGRNISSHIRLIDDIIKYAGEENIEGMTVSLDYQKAFDSVNKHTILAALRRFNFGPRFISYINTILANTQSSVENGGWHSQWFPTERGVRQGCCFSPLLFVLVVELLAIKLRHNDTVNGILRNSNVSDNIKLLQYADMSLLLKGKADLKIALKEIELFTKLSGLKLNRKKLTDMWVGSKADSNEGREGIKWINGEENKKISGVFFNSKREASVIPQNWISKIEEINLLGDSQKGIFHSMGKLY